MGDVRTDEALLLLKLDLNILIKTICSFGNSNTKLWPAPLAHSYRLGLVAWRYQVRIPGGPDICLRGCAYTVLQTVQRNGVYSAVYGTVHYKEPLKSFEIRVGHIVLASGFLLWRYCLNVQKATQSNIHTYKGLHRQNACVTRAFFSRDMSRDLERCMWGAYSGPQEG